MSYNNLDERSIPTNETLISVAADNIEVTSGGYIVG